MRLLNKVTAMLTAAVLTAGTLPFSPVSSIAVASKEDNISYNFNDLRATLNQVLCVKCDDNGTVQDINGDGVVDVFDVGLMKRALMQQIAEHSAEEGILNVAPIKVTNEEEAIEALDTAASRLGLDASAENRFRLGSMDANSNREFYVMQQTYNGVDVYGGSVSLAVDEDGNCDTLVDSFIPGVTGDTKADLTPEQAAEKLSKESEYSEIEQALFVKTVLYPVGDSYRLAHQYLVNAFDADGETLRCDEVFADADTGEVLDTINRQVSDTITHTSTTVKDSKGYNLTYHLERDGDVLQLYDPVTGIQVMDVKKKKSEIKPADENGNILSSFYYSLHHFYIKNSSGIIDSTGSNYVEAKKALEYVEKAYDYYNSLGLQGFCTHPEMKDDRSITILLNDKALKKGSNAQSNLWSMYYNSDVISVEPGVEITIDLLAHEYTHSVIGAKGRFTSGVGEDLALHEAYADIMGEIIENDHTWVHYPNGSNRHADNGRVYGDAEWNRSNDEHSRAMVIFRCAYLIYEELAETMTDNEAMKEIGELWYDSLSYIPSKNASFKDCLRAVREAAIQRGYDADKLNMIRDCFRAVGIELDHNLTTFVVVDEDGKPVRPSWLSVDNRLPLMSMAVEKNVVDCSLRNGEHYVKAEKTGYERTTQYFTVDDEETVVTVVMKKAEPVEVHIGDPVKPTEAPSEEPTETTSEEPTETKPVSKGNLQQVVLGVACSAAITEDGSLYLWGNNGFGQLGDGTTNKRTTPIKIMDNVKSVSLGATHSAAITEDGSLYLWGENTGKLGNGTISDSLSNRIIPTPIKIMNNVKTVSLGYGHSAAITEDGSLYLWGSNTHGECLYGTELNSPTPIKVMDKVKSVSLGSSHSAAITEDGSLYLWGYNGEGQLGKEIIVEDCCIPIKIMDNVKSVSLGSSHSAAITEDGSLYLWGSNSYGQLGDGTNKYSSSPIKIMDNIKSVSLGSAHSAAITKDGSLYVWGNNEYGQLGNGTTTNSSTPIKIMDNVKSVSLGAKHSAAITMDRRRYLWGYNGSGQLGDGTNENRLVPTLNTLPEK